MNTSHKTFLGIVIATLLFQLPQTVFAADPPPIQENGTFGKLEVGLPGIPAGQSIDELVQPGSKPILTFINQAVTAVIAILVIIGLISITIGGYLYMTAAGNGGQVKTAKEWILAALVGIFLALASVIILTTINNYLGKDAQEPTLGTANSSAGSGSKEGDPTLKPIEGSPQDSPSNNLPTVPIQNNSFGGGSSGGGGASGSF